MKKHFLLRLLIFGLFALLTISCSSDVTSPEQNGTLKLNLTDAPSGYDAVNITFSEISAHIDSDWISVVGEPITVNLLDYNNGETFLLGSESLPSGKYTQIRLFITEASVTVDGELHSMTVPSDKLKIGPQFTIEDGITYELVIDFDASRSVVVSGPKDDPKYKLKPHIRAVPMAVTGSISGNVTNHENNPIAYAIQGEDTLTSSIVRDDGTFTLGFLLDGSYRVDVEDDSLQTYSASNVTVNIGENTDLGDIILE